MQFDPEAHAGYISPLTDSEHAALGRIAVLWGQIECMIDLILPAFCDMSQQDLEALGIYDKMMAAKVQFLKTVSKRRAHTAVHDMVLSFTTIIDSTKVARNHAFHSMWGWRLDNRKQTVEPCARRLKEPDKPFKPNDLPNWKRTSINALGSERTLCTSQWARVQITRPTAFSTGQQTHLRNGLCDGWNAIP
jgi:hypothetical protein